MSETADRINRVLRAAMLRRPEIEQERTPDDAGMHVLINLAEIASSFLTSLDNVVLSGSSVAEYAASRGTMNKYEDELRDAVRCINARDKREPPIESEIKLGSVVHIAGQRGVEMTVALDEGNNCFRVVWFDDAKHLQSEVFPRTVLVKVR